MDLIYTNKNKIDIGVLKDYAFDLAFGSDENDFQLSVDAGNNVCEEDYLVYIEGTEYGGIIDAIEVKTDKKEIKYKGRTWHGILNSKIIQPSSGYDYYTVSGDLNTIIGTVLSRLTLTGLFSAKSTSSGITVSNYSFKRYVGGYDGLVALLASAGAKLHMEYLSTGVVELSAVAIHNYSDDELDSDHINFQIKKMYNPVNHLICLGRGELRNRTVIHLYCDASGNISTTQTFTGMEEYADVYDYPNVESSTELRKEGEKKLRELNSSDKIDVNLDDTYEFDIGDILSAVDETTGISVTMTVTKKIVKINKDIITVNYKVGE